MGLYGALHQLMQQREEEAAIPQAGANLADFEFKILHTWVSVGKYSFAVPETMDRILAEEAQNGWELHEKLDDARLRLRRRAACRNQPASPTIPVYRSTVLVREAKIQTLRLVLLTFGIIIGLFALVVLVIVLAAFLTGGFADPSTPH